MELKDCWQTSMCNYNVWYHYFQKRKVSLRELVWFEIDQRCTANKTPKIIKATLSHPAYSFFFLFLSPFTTALDEINEPFGFRVEISQKGNTPVYDRVWLQSWTLKTLLWLWQKSLLKPFSEKQGYFMGGLFFFCLFFFCFFFFLLLEI